MTKSIKTILSILLCLSISILFNPAQAVSALTSDSLSFVVLSQYKATLDIGDEIYILAITSSGKQAAWKSSNSKIASVNTYGIITAKKAGSAVITAKIKNAEASCYVTVNKTKITLDKTAASMEHGESLKLSAVTSNGSPVTWKSKKTSIATVDEYGKVTGMKPGEAIITAAADGSTASCTITVRLPEVRLNQSSATLYRGQTAKLAADVSSGITPKWKTNKKSVVIVDATGTVTAVKNGTAVITATVDGVSKSCEIIVQKPEIILSTCEIKLKTGEKAAITASVSSNNQPVWTISNSNVISVNSKGEITALAKGKAYVYASEDGTKVRCTVLVTE
jgi:uncharacterized protein YjdB